LRLSVRTKLVGGFAIVVALLVGSGVLAITSLGSLNESSKQVAVRVKQLDAMSGVLLAANQTRRDQLQHALASTTAEWNEREKLIAKDRQAFADAFTAYEPFVVDAKDRALANKAKQEWAVYLRAAEPAIALNRAGRHDEAVSLLKEAKTKLDAFFATADSWKHDSLVDTSDDVTAAGDTYASSRTKLIIVIVVASIAGIGLALLISRYLVGAVQKMKGAAEGIAEGDVDQTVDLDSTDELGDMSRAFRAMIAYLREQASVVERVAGGDLTVEVEPRSERDLLGNASRKLVTDLRAVVTNVVGSAGLVASASQEMAATSEETGKAVGEIASAVSEIASGSEQQMRQIDGVNSSATEAATAARSAAEQATEAARAAEEARTVADSGVGTAVEASDTMRAVAESAADVRRTMDGLTSKSAEIGTIVETITGIAEQTNLLALNAAIEAARAGEQGRGFAVVAEEVRKLAEESQQAAERISSLIREIQDETERTASAVAAGAERSASGTAIVDNAREAFEQISEVIATVNARVEQIAGAVEQIAAETGRMQQDVSEVAAVAEQSSASTEQVSASTQQTSASAQEIAASAQQLSVTAEELERLVGQFTLETA
jgi:methyl-accepting chemotaxis protein